MTDIVDVQKIPIRTDLGFPHTIYIKMDNVVYEIFLGFNTEDESLITDITRTRDNVTVFIGKIPLYSTIRVKDPVTGERLFALWANKIDRTKEELDIWVFPRSEKDNTDLSAVLA